MKYSKVISLLAVIVLLAAYWGHYIGIPISDTSKTVLSGAAIIMFGPAALLRWRSSKK